MPYHSLQFSRDSQQSLLPCIGVTDDVTQIGVVLHALKNNTAASTVIVKNVFFIIFYLLVIFN